MESEGIMYKYIIKNTNIFTRDYWNNYLGWTEYRKLATRFTKSEKEKYNLPIGGKWQRI